MYFKGFLAVCAMMIVGSNAEERRNLQYGGGDYAEWVACVVTRDISCCTRWPNLSFCPTTPPTPQPPSTLGTFPPHLVPVEPQEP